MARRRRGGRLGDAAIGRERLAVVEPRVAMPLEAGELILPHAQLGDDLDGLGRKQVDDMTRADLRRPKVKSKVATVSKMTITFTAGTRDGGGAKAAEGVQVLDGGMLTAEEEVRGLPVASGARETILQPRSSLERKGVKRRREVGSGEKDAGCTENDAKKALDVRILLRCVSACKALMNLTRSEKLPKVVAGEGSALIGPHNVRLEGVKETKLGPDVGNEGVEAAGRRVRVHVMRWPDASVARSGVNSAVVDSETIRETGDERTGAVEVENCARSGLLAVEVLVEGERAGSAADDGVADWHAGDRGVSRQPVAGDGFWNASPLVKVREAEPMVQSGLSRAGAGVRWTSGKGSSDGPNNG